MAKDLKKFHEWLSENIDDYVALCEAGSVPAGDTWVEGRSDHDIAIVVEKERGDIAKKVRSYLANSNFDDSYHFFFIDKTSFLISDEHPQAISSKFRGQTLFGEDLVAIKETPSRDFVQEFYEKGLSNLPGSIERRLLNAGYWSNEKVRDKFYQIFKDIFMYLAAKYYVNTGEYPVSRKDVAKVYDEDILYKLLDILEHYNDVNKGTIIGLAEESLELIKGVK